MNDLAKPANGFDFIAHPLAATFPMIEGTALEDLKRDIKARGIIEPIRLFQGQILDGRNRYAAAKACGHKFTLDDFARLCGVSHSTVGVARDRLAHSPEVRRYEAFKRDEIG
jgi:hypothetical protein